MLDTDTRRRIDTARDILVGKVPDPKSQVEQITIALTRCRANGPVALPAGNAGFVSRRRFVEAQTAGCCVDGVMQTGYWLLGQRLNPPS